MTSFGFDIGGSSIKAVRLEATGEIATATLPHEGDPTPASVSDGLGRLFAQLHGDDRTPAEPTNPHTIGLCLPGLVDDEGVLRLAANLPRLVGVRVPDLIPRGIAGDRSPALLTDAAAAGLGSWHARPAQGRLLTLAMGTGVGAALIEHGNLITLDGRTPGHVGQLDVSFGEPDPPIGPDGGRGSLEAYVGYPALLARFSEADLPDRIARLTPDDPAIRALARALRICHAIHKPGEIRLLGGVGALFEPVLPMLFAITSDALTAVARLGWTLTAMNDVHLAAAGVARYAARSIG